ncbi:MAG TPA: hypothetical protein VGT61_14865 [Thermomicrobiales bacterium]|jgi:hypothetical protein|nr:hypothetical protein [Thermomicrobiales bacterium]
MPLTVRAVRLLASIALLLAVALLALPAPAGAAPAAQTNQAPTGTVLPGMVTIQGVYVQDDARAGSFDYFVDITATADTGDYRIPDPVADPQTYLVIDSTNGALIDIGSTGAGGIVVLDGQLDAPFFIAEFRDEVQPFGSDDILVSSAQQYQTVSVTGVVYEPVTGPPASVAPSVAPPSAVPSETVPASPLPSGTATGTILPGAVTIQGLVFEDPARAGEIDYLINVTAAQDVGDYRTAREGEQTYAVVDLTTEQVIDSGSTDANGIVVLDAQTDASYYIVELSDTAEIPGTASLIYPAGDPNAYISVVGIVYVTDLDPVAPSVEPSTAPSVVPSVEPSVPPSADPSVAPSLVPSVVPSVVPSDAPVGQTVTVTIEVAVPDGAQLCLADICQALTAADGVAVAADVPAGTVATFTGILPGTYDLVLSVDGVALYATQVTVEDEPVAVTLGADDAVTGAPSAAPADDDVSVPSAAPSDDDVSVPSAAGSRGAAPVFSDRDDDITVLPNTGAGTSSGDGTMLAAWVLAAVAAVALVAGAIARRRLA